MLRKYLGEIFLTAKREGGYCKAVAKRGRLLLKRLRPSTSSKFFESLIRLEACEFLKQNLIWESSRVAKGDRL